MAILTLIDGALGKLDEWYFRYHCHVNRASLPMFHRGWGSQAALAAVNRRWNEAELPQPIDITWETDWSSTANGLWTRSGSFPTPLHVEHLPPESARADVRWLGGGHVSTIAERSHLIRAIVHTLRPH